jgi:phage terminase large subunit
MAKVIDAGPFKVLYADHRPKGLSIAVVIGGRGGRKTHGISKVVAHDSTMREKRCVILRDEKELIRESILNEVLLRFDKANSNGRLGRVYERLETGIKDRRNDTMMVFTKGFRASATAKTANLKGVSDIDVAVVEEAEDIRDSAKFNTFADSIRKEGALIIIILNTPDINHWVIKQYFNLESVYDENGKVIDGYFNIVPKNIPGFICIKTSYEDNKYLPKHIIDRYKSYGDPDSPLYDLHYYLTAIKGYASTGRKGQIIRKAKPIKLEDYLKLPFKEYYGLDFGTASPAGIVGVKFDKNTIYARQMNYKPMVTLDIGKFFSKLKLGKADLIVADSADPKSIDKLKNGWRGNELSQDEFINYPHLAHGFHVKGAKKGADSIEYGIGLITEMNLFVVEESTDFWQEIYSYVYAQDKYGNYTNDPIDEFNHLIDPLRYIVSEYKSGFKKMGSVAA